MKETEKRVQETPSVSSRIEDPRLTDALWTKLKNLLVSGVVVDNVQVNVALLVVRLFAGITLAFQHGIKKIPPSPRFIETIGGFGFPLPEVLAWAAGFSEFLGGLLLVVGLGTRPASLFIIITMFVAIFFRHASDPFAQKELAVLYAVIAFAFLLIGSGRFGVDDSLRKSSATESR